MKAISIVALIVALLCISSSTEAQSLSAFTEQLSLQARSLSEVAYSGFVKRARGNRADVEALFVTLRFTASADLFRRMVSDNRPQSELRDSIEILRGQLVEMNRYAFGSRERSAMSQTVENMAAQLGLRAGTVQTAQESGSMRWAGRVDGQVIVAIKASTVQSRVVLGDPLRDEDYSFQTPLPRRDLNIQLAKIRGRGLVQVLEQPSRRNDYTAVIAVQDVRGGSDRYEFEISW